MGLLYPDDECKEDSIVHKVSKYFFDDADLSREFTEWTAARCHVIDLDAPLSEYKLKYTELHDEFKVKYERMLEDFIERQGSTVAAFYEQIREAADTDKDSAVAVIGQILLATADFDIFMQMMRDAREEQLASGRHK